MRCDLLPAKTWAKPDRPKPRFCSSATAARMVGRPSSAARTGGCTAVAPASDRAAWHVSQFPQL